jgi:hypothetical protein
MAFLKKWISKNTFLTIIGAWNLASTYVTVHFNLAAETIVFIVALGNLIIGWIGIESGNTKPKEEA